MTYEFHLNKNIYKLNEKINHINLFIYLFSNIKQLIYFKMIYIKFIILFINFNISFSLFFLFNFLFKKFF